MLTFPSEYLVKFCNFYPHLCLETVSSALKLTQICCINIYDQFFFWKLAISSQISSSSPTHIPRLKDCPYNPTKYESKQNLKTPIFQLFSELGEIWSELGEIWKYSLSWHSKIQIFHHFHELEKIVKFS